MTRDAHKSLHRILEGYKHILREQEQVRHDAGKISQIEARVKHLEASLSHLTHLTDAAEFAKKANQILREEKTYLDEMDQDILYTIKWAKRQRKRIRDLRRKM